MTSGSKALISANSHFASAIIANHFLPGSDIDEGITNSKIISFADDTRLYNSVSEVEDCDLLQVDLDTIYKWADANNMTFNSNMFFCSQTTF